MSTSSDEAFRTYLEPHRRAITAHCYRMLGSLQDAEEITQESLLRGWQRLGELRDSGAAKAWLYRIATNACLDHLKQRRRRRGSRISSYRQRIRRSHRSTRHERLWIEPAPDALFEADDEGKRPDEQASMRESVSLRIHHGAPTPTAEARAALLLSDVLGWRPRETAELLRRPRPP